MNGLGDADKLARSIGALAGLCLAAALILAARPASGDGGVLPARLGVSARQDGAVTLSPAAPRPLVPARSMRPGDRAVAPLRMSNQTGSPLSVAFRARPSSGELDGIARVRILADGRAIADETIQGLRRPSPGRIRLAPGASAKVRVEVAIPAAVETGYEGRRVRLALEPVEEPRR